MTRLCRCLSGASGRGDKLPPYKRYVSNTCSSILYTYITSIYHIIRIGYLYRELPPVYILKSDSSQLVFMNLTYFSDQSRENTHMAHTHTLKYTYLCDV